MSIDIAGFLSELFGKKTQAAIPPPEDFPYAEFQRIFQLYSSLYTRHDINGPELEPEDDPLFIATGILEGFGSDLGESLTSDPATMLTDLTYIRSPQNNWVIFGEYKKADPGGAMHEYLFLTVVGASPKGPDDDPDAPDVMYEPHFAMEAQLGYATGECRVYPLFCANLVQVTPEESMIAMMGPHELHKSLCSADAAFCQVAAGQPLQLEANQSWLHDLPDLICHQKMLWMQQRDLNGLRDVVEEMGGHLPAPGRG